MGRKSSLDTVSHLLMAVKSFFLVAVVLVSVVPLLVVVFSLVSGGPTLPLL